MSETSDHPQSQPSARLPLNVLPHSGKIDQLREELKANPRAETGERSSKNLADQTIIERAVDPTRSPQQKAIVEKVIDVLRTVFDPELPVNIYELGLIYEIAVDDSHAVKIKMTLTAPGCPVAGTLPPEVARKIEAIPEVTSAQVELVWEPAWTKDRMSEVAMLELGL